MVRCLVPVLLGLILACAGESSTTTTAPVESTSLVVIGGTPLVEIVDPHSGEVIDAGADLSSTASPQAIRSPSGEVAVWAEVTEEGPVVALLRDGETRRVEVPMAPFYFQFSPDESHLAILGNDPGGDGVALGLVTIESGESQILDRGSPYFIDWSVGNRFAVHVGNRLVATLEPGADPVPTSVEPGFFQAPDWIDESRFVVVTSTQGAVASAGEVQAEISWLSTVDPTEDSIRHLVRVDGPSAFQVSPTGERLAYVSGLQGGAVLGELAVVELGGDQSPTVVADEVAIMEWSPDARLLLYGVVDSQRGMVPHVWDGESSAEFEAYVPTQRFAEEYLPFWSQYVRSITQWSPDGSAFAYAAVDEDGAGIWIQPLDGERSRVADGDMVIWGP